MKTVSIHQPHYLIWLGLLDKIARSDLYVLLDNVQFSKRGFQHRTQYSTKSGNKYLSLPVKSKGVQCENTKIKDILIADEKKIKKHYTTLCHRYSKTPGWPLIKDKIDHIYSEKHKTLVEINQALLDLTLTCYQVSTPVIRASELKVEGNKSELILSILKNVNANIYLSGNGARRYMDHSLFADANITIRYQKFEHPQYDQNLNTSFSPACFALEWFLLDPMKSVKHFKNVSSDEY